MFKLLMEIDEKENRWLSLINSYDITDSIEINEIVEGWNKIAQSNAGNLHLYAYTVNSIQEGESVALAESTYIFTPSTNLLTLNVIGYVTQWARASFSLFDLTADCEIVKYGSPDTPPYNLEISWQQDFQLNPLHQYRFEMYSMTSPGEDGDGGVELNAVFTPVPATLFLLGVIIYGLRLLPPPARG
ncbi:MAG: hypothetical protein BWY69_01646 [Planctomycetes bacterium ADurb.Bin401]|nr:MAG: hypothetical protein BWY69_01646 [Planctomycetes bacterium ADurb.Bin401]